MSRAWSDHDWRAKFGDVGVEYRMRVGQHLGFRLDGRFVRGTDGVGNAVAIAASGR